jgi:glycerol-3-phosphate dehydrogenase (NAD(P)+)
MGTTLAHVVASNGTPTTLWTQNTATLTSINERRRHDRMFTSVELAPRLRATASLEEAISGACLVIAAVRSAAFEDLAGRLGPQISSHQIVLSATKGFHLEPPMRMSELVRRATRASPVGTIAGPNITSEIMAGSFTSIVIATSDPSATATAAALLRGPRLHVYANDDLVGVESFAALKNVVAIAVGIATGLGLAVNTRSVVLARGIAEISELVDRLGGSRTTFWGLAGIADLFLTCTSGDSLNREVGVQLGAGRHLTDIVSSLPEVPEGIQSVRACQLLARANGLTLPIAKAVCDFVDGGISAREFESVIEGHGAFEVDRTP